MGKSLEDDLKIIFSLRVIPNSSKTELSKDGDVIKLKITAQPIENKANKAVIEFFAKKLRIAKSKISIIKGELSKDKTILILGIDEQYFEQFLNIRL